MKYLIVLLMLLLSATMNGQKRHYSDVYDKTPVSKTQKAQEKQDRMNESRLKSLDARYNIAKAKLLQEHVTALNAVMKLALEEDQLERALEIRKQIKSYTAQYIQLAKKGKSPLEVAKAEPIRKLKPLKKTSPVVGLWQCASKGIEGSLLLRKDGTCDNPHKVKGVWEIKKDHVYITWSTGSKARWKVGEDKLTEGFHISSNRALLDSTYAKQ